ncbi:MAG: glycoside hydrolase family 92 protein, partial [bacterium]|nr:glycoside hydrolase family 92 protein [bacterium]
GNKSFIKMLDTLFTMHTPDEAIAETEDIEKNGIMGGYIHGNEPGHHIPYLYNYAGAPWKTQAFVHRIMDTMYSNEADGIPGNDDTGQMSAWYVFSALGFYPVCPGSNEYVMAGPGVQKAAIRLDNGNVFTITARNLSKQNVYIQSVRLNGKRLKKSYIKHQDIMQGGRLEFVMGAKPNKKWAVKPGQTPYSMTQ